MSLMSKTGVLYNSDGTINVQGSKNQKEATRRSGFTSGSVEYLGGGSRKPAPVAAAAPAAAPTPGDGAASYTNTANTQPDMRYALDSLTELTEGDMGAGRATDLALNKIRELEIGLNRASTADAASRGGLGTGMQDFLRRDDSERLRREMVGAASDIASDAEGRRVDVLSRILSGGQGAGALAQGDRGLALEQQRMVEEARRA